MSAAGLRDAAARRAAASCFERPLLVEAGAGTGKTATLVARVLTWVLGPGWERARRQLSERESTPPSDDVVAARVLRGVTAITFTDAAAAEMAARVGAGLAAVDAAVIETRIEEEHLPPGLDPDLLPEAGSVGPRARALRAALDQLDVSTFHAFCRRVLLAHPFEAGLAPNFELDASGRRTRQVLREVLEEFLRGDRDERLEAALLTLARAGRGPADLEEALLGLHREGLTEEDLAEDPFREACVDAFLEDLDGWLRAFSELLADPLLSVKRATSTHASTQALLDLRPIIDEARESPAPPRERLRLVRERLVATLGRSERGKIAKLVSGEWGKGETEVLTALDPRDRDAGLDALRQLGASLPRLQEIDFGLLDEARLLTGELLGRLRGELRRQGVASYEDLLVEARALLERFPAVARRVRASMEQLLVDEFQDTDAIQSAIVRSLAFEGDESERPALFVVGDPKQSIYAWRRADLAAYDAFRAELEAAGGELLTLTTNFRSVPRILDEVERCLEPVMEEVAGVQPPFVPLDACRADHRGVAVEHWVTTKPPGAPPRNKTLGYASEARAIARDLSRNIREEGLEPGDAALLFRTATGLDVYLDALRAEGIPFEVRGDRTYYRQREVLDANALVRAILDPADRIALAAFLRSPVAGMPDAALVRFLRSELVPRLAACAAPDPQVLEALRKELTDLAQALPAVLPGLGAVEGWQDSVVAGLAALLESRATYETLPFDLWLESLRDRFDLESLAAARYLGRYRVHNLERFFRELAALEVELAGDTQAILRELRAQVEADEDTDPTRVQILAANAVQVMTLHGAKGLEFRHVYLPQTHKESSGGRKKSTVRVLRRGNALAYDLFGTCTLEFSPLEQHTEAVAAAERVRLLYVGLTRAKDRLVVLGDWSPSKKVRDWRTAKALGALVTFRRDSAKDALLAQVDAGEEALLTDGDGVLWCTSAYREGEAPTARAGTRRAATAPVSADRIAEDLRRLAGLSRDARERAARPYHASPSGLHGSDTAETAAERGANAFVARTVGTLLHRWIETQTLAEVAGDEGALRVAVSSALVGAPAPTRAAALERATFLLGRMHSNGLLERLTRERDRVLARELPFLAPPSAVPEDGRPVGFVAGAIDLVLRDPATAAPLVVDFKTDRIDSAEDVERRAAIHAPQGRSYCRAVRDALALDETPPFELWFLGAPSAELAVRRLEPGELP